MGRNQGKLNLGCLGCRLLCLFASCCTVDQHQMSLSPGPRCHRDQGGSDRLVAPIGPQRGRGESRQHQACPGPAEGAAGGAAGRQVPGPSGPGGLALPPFTAGSGPTTLTPSAPGHPPPFPKASLKVRLTGNTVLTKTTLWLHWEDKGMGNEGQGPEKVPKSQLPQQGTKS